MRIVSLAPFVPHRDVSHAGGVFLHHYLAGLAAQGDDVTLVAPATAANRRAIAGQLPAGVAVQLLTLPAATERTWARAALYPYEVLTAPSPGVLTTRAFRHSAELCELIRTADVAEIQWSQFLPLATVMRGRRPDVPIGAVLHDLYGASLGQLARHSESRRIRSAARLTHREAGRRELALVGTCDLAFSFNDRERQILEDTTGTPTALIDPWIDWPQPGTEPTDEASVLFVGDLSRHENHEAARWLATEVWPRVLQSEPSARLVLAGANPPESVARLTSASIEVTGYVQSLEPYYARARVFAAPLRTGAGLKFKVAQALACGLPVVATPVAADGFAERGGESVFGAIADDPDDFAAGLVRFLADRSLAVRTGADAATWARSAFSFDRTITRVRDAYAERIELSR